jgi:FKBP-type peptidyl-prolyl cis-trans isomerase
MKKVIGILTVIVVCCISSCKKDDVQIDPKVQLANDDATIDAYLTANGINAIKDTSGMRYVITTLGTGKKPEVGSTVTLKTVAKYLSNGNVYAFDSTGTAYAMTDLIKGLQDILPLFPKGSTFTAYIPSTLAFGAFGSIDGAIAPNTNLIFDVYLVDDDLRLALDKEIIDTYLANHDISGVQKDTSGLRYVIKSIGSGSHPVATSNVSVTYTGSYLDGGAQFASVTVAQTVTLSTLIAAWKIGLPLIQSGGSIELYVPSKLAYGPSGTSDGIIPPNAILIFKISLISVD